MHSALTNDIMLPEVKAQKDAHVRGKAQEGCLDGRQHIPLRFRDLHSASVNLKVIRQRSQPLELPE